MPSRPDTREAAVLVVRPDREAAALKGHSNAVVLLDSKLQLHRVRTANAHRSLATTPGVALAAPDEAKTGNGGSAYDRACGGDRRRRSDGADAGGRAGVGGRRRRHRRAARQPGPPRLARRRSALTHHRGPRSARNRRSVPRRRDRWPRSRGSPAIRLDISDFPTRHPYGLGLWQNHIERILAGWVGELAVPIYRGREVTGLRAGRHRRRRRSCPTASRCGRSISSGATEDAAWSARQPASSSPAGIRRRAPCSPRSR